ncbi:MAG: hypothetical protein L0Z48_03720 [candidate division Zixibacteria bacterium]|nr:hypothetical protein [candidate division Zixibacteria bacterium]MCI0595635.1 hypothetical protein [candidate division Zixibacteria bacterium]
MKKIALALALVLLPASAQPSPASPSPKSFPQRPALTERGEARLDQQKSKWAPNGMKVLIIHGKRRWVEGQGQSRRPVDKRKCIPILKEGV